MPLTIDHNLNEGLQLHGVSVEHFAKLAHLCGIPRASKAKLYESFRGGKSLDNETAVKLWELWKQILDLIERAAPFQIAFNDPSHTKLLIDLIGDGLDVGVGRPLTTVVENEK